MRLILDRLYLIGGGLAALFMIGIFSIVLLQVAVNLLDFIIAKFAGEPLGLAIPSYSEIAGFFLAGASFLALPYALRNGAHIRVSLFIQKLPPQARKFADVWSYTIGAGISLWLCYYTWELVAESLEYGDLSPGLIPIPIWIPQLPMALGISLLALSMIDGALSTLFHDGSFETAPENNLGGE